MLIAVEQMFKKIDFFFFVLVWGFLSTEGFCDKTIGGNLLEFKVAIV